MKTGNRFILVSACLYFASLTQAAFYDPSYDIGYGYLRLQLPVYMSYIQYGWIANPLLFCTWFLTYLDRPALVRLFAGLAILSASLFLFQRVIYIDGADLLRPGPGYLLWIASMIVMAVKATSAHRVTGNVVN